MLFQPPFPPSELESDAIINIGLMFGHLIIILLLLFLMIYFFNKLKYPLLMIVVYLFSLIIDMICIGSESYIPFQPWTQIFLMVLQTSIFIIFALEFNKRGK